ncbi:putative sulfate transporter [Propionicimonas sp. T2.31MG-18]|uniref:SulP family inorganic anion transporter n=1 Tax=Propionicimonas sp. T2.31MG-18 TaxID=3157620 RepID=UPI0035F09717
MAEGGPASRRLLAAARNVLPARLLPGVTRRNLARELLAGVSLIAIAVPLNVGYAQIAGLPATAGLYALVVPTLVYVFLVSSRQLVASPDAAASALVFSSLLALGASEGNLLVLASAQAIVGGLILLAAGLLRLGFLADFLSRPILIGFVSGLAAEILVSQVAKMLGVSLGHELGFFEKLLALVTLVPRADPWSTAVGAFALALLLVGRRFLPRVPWALAAILVCTAASAWLELPARGVAVLGAVQAGPPVFAVPLLSWRAWLSLVPSAIALAMVAMAEGLLLARSYGERNGYPTRPNQDLVALGLANITAGFSSSYSVGASGSRTAAMDAAGSRTQLPGVVLAVGSFLLLVAGTGLLASIPSPAIGAIVAVAVWGLLGVDEYRLLWRESRSEFGVAVVCALGVLVVGAIGGILIAFVLSLVNLARRAANPPVDVLVGPDDPHISLTDAAGAGTQTAPGVIVLRFAAPVFFANGNLLLQRAKEVVTGAPAPVRALVLDLEGVTDIDVTGAGSLRLLRSWLADRGVDLAYTRVRADLATRLKLFELWSGTAVLATNREAVARYADTARDGADAQEGDDR